MKVSYFSKYALCKENVEFNLYPCSNKIVIELMNSINDNAILMVVGNIVQA